jgi:hypothetical protein
MKAAKVTADVNHEAREGKQRRETLSTVSSRRKRMVMTDEMRAGGGGMEAEVGQYLLELPIIEGDEPYDLELTNDVQDQDVGQVFPNRVWYTDQRPRIQVKDRIQI